MRRLPFTRIEANTHINTHYKLLAPIIRDFLFSYLMFEILYETQTSQLLDKEVKKIRDAIKKNAGERLADAIKDQNIDPDFESAFRNAFESFEMTDEKLLQMLFWTYEARFKAYLSMSMEFNIHLYAIDTLAKALGNTQYRQSLKIDSHHARFVQSRNVAQKFFDIEYSDTPPQNKKKAILSKLAQHWEDNKNCFKDNIIATLSSPNIVLLHIKSALANTELVLFIALSLLLANLVTQLPLELQVFFQAIVTIYSLLFNRKNLVFPAILYFIQNYSFVKDYISSPLHIMLLVMPIPICAYVVFFTLCYKFKLIKPYEPDAPLSLLKYLKLPQLQYANSNPRKILLSEPKACEKPPLGTSPKKVSDSESTHPSTTEETQKGRGKYTKKVKRKDGIPAAPDKLAQQNIVTTPNIPLGGFVSNQEYLCLFLEPGENYTNPVLYLMIVKKGLLKGHLEPNMFKFILTAMQNHNKFCSKTRDSNGFKWLSKEEKKAHEIQDEEAIKFKWLGQGKNRLLFKKVDRPSSDLPQEFRDFKQPSKYFEYQKVISHK